MADYERNSNINSVAPLYWRHLGEINITGSQRGVGRIGADFWPAVKDKRGQRKGPVWARYPESSRRNLDIYSCVLAPGPDGPVATAHYECFREGVQECEARIFIEQALTDKALRERLGPDLAGRCQEALDERVRCLYRGLSHLQLTGPGWYYLRWRGMPAVAGNTWFVGSGWQARTEKLFRLAAEVQTRLAAGS